MSNPVWFVVVRRNGRDEPGKYRDFLPHWIRGKNAQEWGVVSVTQLDILEHPEFWTGLRPYDLYNLWQRGLIGNPAVIEQQNVKRGDGKWPMVFGFEGM